MGHGEEQPQALGLLAEAALIGQIMALPKVNPEIVDRLRVGTFQDPRHRLIWAAVRDLVHGEHGDAPALAIGEKLKAEGSINTAGGEGYLMNLLEGQMIPTGSLAKSAEIIEQAARLREVSSVGRSLVHAAQGMGSDLSAALERIRGIDETLDAATQTRGRTVDGWTGLMQATQEAYAAPISTGFHTVDRVLRLCPGHLLVIGGRPGSGKTTLALQIALQMLGQDREAVALFASCEMEASAMAMKAASCLASADLVTPIRSGENEPTAAALETAMRHRHVIERLHVLPARSMSDITTQAHRMRRQGKLAVVVVDYLQAMSAPGGGNHETRSREVGAVSRACKVLAMDCKTLVVAAAQLNRGSADGRRPGLSDLRDSGEIEQDCETCVLIHRPEAKDGEPETCDLIVAKNRWGEQGALSLRPNLAAHRFEEQAKRFATPEAARAAREASANWWNEGAEK